MQHIQFTYFEIHEKPGQELRHKAPNLQAIANATPNTVIRTRIKCPLANDSNGWKSLDGDLSEILRATLKEGADRLLWCMSTIIVGYSN